MGSLVAEHLIADAASVRAARRLVGELAGDALPSGELDELLLCTSEIVTNAIEHGAEPIDLLITVDDDQVRVEVRDGSVLPPRLGNPAPSETRGRGLQIVDRCSTRWGADDLGDSGKAVWFEFDLGRQRTGNASTPPQ